MSYDSSKFIYPGTDGKQQGPFSGGYVDNVKDHLIADVYSPYLRNCRLFGPSIKIRPGHSLFATLTAGDYPRGIGAYIRSSASNDRIVVRHNTDGTHKLYTITSAGTTTSIVTGANIASDNRMHFQNGNDVIFCMNGSDTIGKLSGTTYSLLTAIPASFAPSFSTIFNGAHWVSGWSTNPNKVYISVGSTFDDFTGTGSDNLELSEPCTSLAGNNETLFYFTKNTVSATSVSDIIDTSGTLTYITRPLQVKEGAINNASTVAVGNYVFYVTPSNKIARIRRGQNIDGFEVEELSDRPYSGISTIMASLDNDQSASFGYYYQPDNLIKWFFKSDGSLFNDVCIIYDIEKNAFLIDTDKYFYGGTMFEGKAYTISMLEPKVYEDEVDQDDEDSPIDFEYRTKKFNLGDPSRKKILWETRTYVSINELAELTQEIYVDDILVDTKTIDLDNIPNQTGGIGSLPIGSFPIGDEVDNQEEMNEVYILRSKGVLNVKGKTIQFRFLNTTLAGKVELHNLQIKVEILPEIASDLTI